MRDLEGYLKEEDWQGLRLLETRASFSRGRQDSLTGSRDWFCVQRVTRESQATEAVRVLSSRQDCERSSRWLGRSSCLRADSRFLLLWEVSVLSVVANSTICTSLLSGLDFFLICLCFAATFLQYFASTRFCWLSSSSTVQSSYVSCFSSIKFRSTIEDRLSATAERLRSRSLITSFERCASRNCMYLLIRPLTDWRLLLRPLCAG